MKPEHEAQFGAFHLAAYQHICKAMKEMSDDPRGKAFPRDVMLTALAMACVRSCALALTPSDISMDDVAFIGNSLSDEVKRMRQSAADKGLIRMKN